MQILRFNVPSKGLSIEQIREDMDVFFLVVSGVIIIGYLISYIAFSQMHRVKNLEIKELVCDLGKLGLGFIIVGHIAFLKVYQFLGNAFSVLKAIDNFTHLFFLALMIFYVYHCTKELSKISFK